MSTAEQPVDDPTEASGPATLDTPVVLGRYCLGCELAAGGMATVYLAVATDTRYVARPIALKRIHPHLAKDRAFIDMFIDEARIASRLNHPNLCGVLDFGEVNGTYFMTMEYLVGEPLNLLQISLVRRRESLDLHALGRIAAQIVSDACEGLHAAHELRDDDGRPLDVVHRDVSPSNLFVNYDGLTRVVDFGIASAVDRLQHTTTGSVKGKFGYMAPEHLSGERTDRRADVWALGVVLWEALTLRRLFRRENATRSMLATIEGKVPPVHEMVPGLDPAFSAIIARAVHMDRDQRYPDALAMAHDLQRWLAASGTPNARPEVARAMREAFPTGERDKRGLVKAVVEGRRTIDALTLEQSPPSDTNPSVRDPRGSHSGVMPKLSGPPGAPDVGRTRGLARRLRVPALAALSIVAGAGSAYGMLEAMARPPRQDARVVALASADPGMRMGDSRASVADGTRRGAVAPPPGPIDEFLVGGATNGRPARGGIGDGNALAANTEGRPSARAADEAAEESSRALPAETETPAAQPHAADARAARAHADPEPQGGHESRDARATASAGSHTGVVSVTTVGDWAQVYHRGRSLGPTPGRFTLPEGRQVLSLRPGSGGAARSVVVDVDANTMVRVRTEL